MATIYSLEERVKELEAENKRVKAVTDILSGKAVDAMRLSNDWMEKHDRLNKNIETWGIVEIAVRNPNVASYMEHWEGRATKAEEALSHKEYYDAMRSREIQITNIPEKERPFVTALLNQRDDYYKHMTDAKERIFKLEDFIRELLKGGEHEGECDNDQGMMNEGGACQKHCDANDAREAAARKLLEEA